MGEKRFAVLLCAEDSEFVKKKYGGYFAVFVGMLREEGEVWDLFRVASGEFPEEEEEALKLYDGFVITGSCNDAHGNDLWICKLLSLLKKLNSMKKKVLGICFGHQILVRALGGKTGRASSGWDIGVTKINLKLPSTLMASLQLPSSLPIIECHRDEVRELPEEAEAIAWSSKTRVEMFKYGNHILGIQGHPEYNKDILHHLLDRLVHANLILESKAEEVKECIEGCEPDRDTWKRLCRSFLKGQLVL